ncbi:MAG: phage major capsid protein, partial [Clostridia bacterium]
PFVCTSKLAAFGSVTAGKPYMLYGKLKGYELTYFTDLEVTKSTDYKFKEGVIAFKASGMVGGSPAMWNGFIKINKAAGV